MNLSVAEYRPQNFTNYLSDVKFADPSFGKLFVNLFSLMVNNFEWTYFRFCDFVPLISNMLMVGKEELFIKSPKLQKNLIRSNPLKSRSF